MISPAAIHEARILIVDDEPADARLLDYLLSSTGYRAVSATADGASAVALHAQQHFDLIILDLHMPGEDGFAVMAALAPGEREAGAYLPVMVVTADPDLKLAALQAGARDFISKPFDPLEVLTRIRNFLEVRLMHREALLYNTRLEQAVRARAAQLQRFRRAMDASDDAIFLIDVDGMALVDVNEGACRMLGYRREALLALAPAQLRLGEATALAGRATALMRDSAPALQEAELERGDQVLVPVEIAWRLQPAADSDHTGAILIAVARDISERRAAQERYAHLMRDDSLTGLPSRSVLYQTLAETIDLAQAKAWRIVVLFIGLDRFKRINDLFGTAQGDALLRQCGARLLSCARLRDTVGRVGGDEFALILTMHHEQRDAVHVAVEVGAAMRAPFALAGRTATLTASIGIAVYPDDASDADTLLKFADTAMRRARQAGGDGYRFFTAGMNVQVADRLDLELALQLALQRDEFLLYYQPKVNLHTGRVGGVEALLRWRRPGHGIVQPGDFVPLLEESGLIVPVGSWIIDRAARQIAVWCSSDVGPVRVAVNVASRQFVEGDLYADVCAALEKYAISADLLELELTESALMSNADHTIAVLAQLRALGVKIAIDDFGTGYSSLAYLQRFPIDKLKIDIAFVRNVTTNPNDAAIALAIISMAHSLKLDVIAEGVEALAQLEYLRRNRCDEIQGFYFSRPLVGRDLGRLLAAGASLPVATRDTPQQTLLIIDDDVNVLSALYRLLRRDGYHILTAETAEEGFTLLALQGVHVILCDQRMPGMHGTAFFEKVKDMYPQTIRIILTADTGAAAVIDSINRGAVYRYYTKPWDDAELRDNVRLAFHHYWMMTRPQHADSAGDYETTI